MIIQMWLKDDIMIDFWFGTTHWYEAYMQLILHFKQNL